jgi:hypothetical protein
MTFVQRGVTRGDETPNGYDELSMVLLFSVARYGERAVIRGEMFRLLRGAA